jgi:hypothetical protein
MRIGTTAAITAASVALLFAVNAGSAMAADGCGSGYHKQEDGVIGASKSGSQDNRSLTASVIGKVRWCTRGRTAARDQFFQRVKVGIPAVIQHRATYAGKRSRICLTSSFTATIANGAAAQITIGTDSQSVTITTSGQSSKTVTLPKLCKSGAAAQTTTAFQQAAQNFSVTVPSCGLTTTQAPRVKSITFASIAYVRYRKGSETRDYTLRSSNTDVPNDLPFFSC